MRGKMSEYPPISPYAAGAAGKCPRCGRGALFKGYLGLRDRCEVCGLDYSIADAGDGPAVFAIFIVGFLAVVLAFVVRFVFYAPMIVSLLIASVGAILMIGLLMRPLKATLFALQYRHKAEEGRLSK
jgi:uncharacterized protein (DUF983 family)